MNIRGRIVTLRALEPDDMEALRSFHNDPDIAERIGGWSFPLSAAEQRQWYERVVTDPGNKRWAIDVDGEGFIGICTLTSLEWRYRSAVHGIMIGKKQLHGRGYGTDVVMASMRYAFEELGLERLEADIAATNEGSLRVYTGKCGWRPEGRRRRSIFRGNRWLDSHLISILREEYLELVERSGYWNAV